MGVNLSKIKDRQKVEEQKEAARQTGGVRSWKPPSGRSNIRLLPPWTDEGPNAGDFAREVFTHWNVGDGEAQRTFTCPLKTPDLGGPCVVCDHVSALRATGDPVDSENAQEDSASQGFQSNIIDLDDPVFTQKDYDDATNGGKDVSWSVGDTKVQLFRYGPMIYKQLLDLFADLQMDLTDLVTGRDLILKKSGQGKTGTKYNVILGADPTPVSVVGGPIEKQLYGLDDLYPPRTPVEMSAALNGVTPPGAGTQQPPGLPPMPQNNLAAPEPQEEEPPECFKDASVFDEADAECSGGMKDGSDYDPCPFFKECGIATGKLSAPAPSRRRRPPSNGAAAAPSTESDALLQQMNQAMDKL